MKKTIILFFCVMFLLNFSSCSQHTFSKNPGAIEKATESIVEIIIRSNTNEIIATGSGFFIFDSNTIVTNYHVIENEEGYRIEIVDYFNNVITATHIRNADKSKDLAILTIKGDDNSYVPLSLSENSGLKKGETVVAIGNPLGIRNTVSIGIISNFEKTDGIDMIQFTASISSGSSGGALFNDNGDIIGVTSASYIEGQNLNLAISSKEILGLYSETPLSETVSQFYSQNKSYTNNYNNSSNKGSIDWDKLYKSGFLKEYGEDFETDFFNMGKKYGETRAQRDNMINKGYQEGYTSAIEEFQEKYPLLDIIVSCKGIPLYEVPEREISYKNNRSKVFSYHSMSIPSEYYNKCQKSFYSGYDKGYNIYIGTFENNESQSSYESYSRKGYELGYSQFVENDIVKFKSEYPILSFIALLDSVILIAILITISIIVLLTIFILSKKRSKKSSVMEE